MVEQKQRIGDWEGDTVVSGKDGTGALVTLVDRASKYTLMQKVERKTAEATKEAIIALLKAHKRKAHTLTLDNGTEFAKHTEIGHALKAKTYFATPYRSWERGLNEHTNGLIRQFFPKKTNFNEVTDREVNAVQKLLNNRPRKVLGYQTPTEIFSSYQLSSFIL
jgi:Transposase and inactivated derivatives, IS30 family